MFEWQDDTLTFPQAPSPTITSFFLISDISRCSKIGWRRQGEAVNHMVKSQVIGPHSLFGTSTACKSSTMRRCDQRLWSSQYESPLPVFGIGDTKNGQKFVLQWHWFPKIGCLKHEVQTIRLCLFVPSAKGVTRGDQAQHWDWIAGNWALFLLQLYNNL